MSTETTRPEWAVYATEEGRGEYVAVSGVQRYETVTGWLSALESNPGFISARVTEREVTTTYSDEQVIKTVEKVGGRTVVTVPEATE